jgi:hypothetical protein
MRRVLRVAALEGMSFTVEALANVLAQPADELTAWLERSPLVEGGVLTGAPGDGPERRFHFESRLLWVVLHPVYGAPRAAYDSPEVAELARRYAAALCVLYADNPGRAISAISELCRLAGAPAAARHVANFAASLASLDDYQRILQAELAAHERYLTGPLHGTRLGSATRSVRAVNALRGTGDSRALVQALRAALRLVRKGPPDDRATQRVEATVLFELGGVCASIRASVEAAQCYHAAATLYARVGDTPARARAALRGASVLARTSDPATHRAHSAELAPDQLPSPQHLLAEAHAAIVSLHSAWRGHLVGEYELTRAQIASSAGQRGRAVEYATQALRHFADCTPDCSYRSGAQYLLGRNLAAVDAQAALPALDEALSGVVARGELVTAARLMAEIAQAHFRLGDKQRAAVMLAHAILVSLQMGANEQARSLWSDLEHPLPHARSRLSDTPDPALLAELVEIRPADTTAYLVTLGFRHQPEPLAAVTAALTDSPPHPDGCTVPST